MDISKCHVSGIVISMSFIKQRMLSFAYCPYLDNIKKSDEMEKKKQKDTNCMDQNDYAKET